MLDTFFGLLVDTPLLVDFSGHKYRGLGFFQVVWEELTNWVGKPNRK